MRASIYIHLNEDEIEDVKRLQAAMQKESPSAYSRYSVEDVVGYVARSGFDKSLLELTKFYEDELAKNKRPYESANSGAQK